MDQAEEPGLCRAHLGCAGCTWAVWDAPGLCGAHLGCAGPATGRLCAVSHQGPEPQRRGHRFQGQRSGRWRECAPTPSVPPHRHLAGGQ